MSGAWLKSEEWEVRMNVGYATGLNFLRDSFEHPAPISGFSLSLSFLSDINFGPFCFATCASNILIILLPQ